MGRFWTSVQVIGTLLLLAAAIVGLSMWSAAADAQERAERAAAAADEARKADRLQLTRAHIKTAEELQARVNALTQGSAELRDKLDVAQRELKARPVVVAEHSTGAITVPMGERPQPEGASTGDGSVCITSLEPAPCPEPVIDVRTTVVGAQGEHGTMVVTGKTDVWRIKPPPEQLVISMPWSDDTTNVDYVKDDELEEELAGLMAGPVIGFMSGRPAVGGMLLGREWSPNLWIIKPKVRPFVLAMGSSEDWLIAGGAAGAW